MLTVVTAYMTYPSRVCVYMYVCPYMSDCVILHVCVLSDFGKCATAESARCCIKTSNYIRMSYQTNVHCNGWMFSFHLSHAAKQTQNLHFVISLAQTSSMCACKQLKGEGMECHH